MVLKSFKCLEKHGHYSTSVHNQLPYITYYVRIFFVRSMYNTTVYSTVVERLAQ